jgi:hypothetical protein
MKTVTKEQVEKALNNNCMKEDMLNELFPEFKAGDYLTPIERNTGMAARTGCVCLVEHNTETGQVIVKWISETSQHDGDYHYSNFRHATPEEIESATWKEGELYRVNTGGDCWVRVSSKSVGWFYNGGRYEGVCTYYDKYEKINTCRCGFCVKEKEG